MEMSVQDGPAVGIPKIRWRRKITGMSAMLLPISGDGQPDWEAYSQHLERTIACGLTPAVNMDTGYANLISDHQRAQVLELTRQICGDTNFVGGVFVSDQPGDPFNEGAYEKGIDQVRTAGGWPIIFQSFGLTGQSDLNLIRSYERLGEISGQFLAFELSEVFAPMGKVYPLEIFRELLQLPSCVGAKHSSLDRQLEWKRLQVRDQTRPDFKLLTGNDLAIDMVMYGSDYLLGLSTFAPEQFALRDRYWQAGDLRFFELNDLLQYLGQFAFRAPVPGYKHNAAQFLKLRGHIETDLTYPGAPRRPASDIAVLADLSVRLHEIHVRSNA